MQAEAAFNTEGKRHFVLGEHKMALPREVMTQGHRHAIELYLGETALLASGSEFLNTIAKNAPAIAQVSATAPQITGETGKKMLPCNGR